ncbi:hypothetical protein BpHYR1_043401 [Brachionus plicatilis]|uniref:Uncharacterized protein n=1 Tax=Brachionus plicatilis TaxID=10195 RepID=A0A3M7RL61_BRAPC|nr:hypothetical protein BpHYR1_043401 [Brachionus plicatilis]
MWPPHFEAIGTHWVFLLCAVLVTLFAGLDRKLTSPFELAVARAVPSGEKQAVKTVPDKFKSMTKWP